ncbi:MAG: hypothetical protein LBV15_05110 [Planctomycetota bacterium]|jgi:hypothetical protein|nr:hypothetical protein [Planctomycetota bacterium]
MSSIRIIDRHGGKYQAVVEFTYGECERLPFNALRRINARLEIIPGGGLRAAAEFNIRSPKDSTSFLEILDLFGEAGSYVHGSAADTAALAKTSPGDQGGVVTLGSIDMGDDLELEDEPDGAR